MDWTPFCLCLAYFVISFPNRSQAEGWSSWEQWSRCSRSCGCGIARRSRQCVNSLSGGCQPPTDSSQFRSCNVDDCPFGSKDFRAVQCSRYDAELYDGKYHTWIPYSSESANLNPCQLFCLSLEENFYTRRNLRVTDGTKCGNNGVCVQGQCRPIGCDCVLDSPKQFDKCGVCGGDGSSCLVISNKFIDTNIRIGHYNEIARIPQTAYNVRVTEDIATANFLAVADINGTYIVNGNFRTVPSGSYHGAGTVFVYSRSTNGKETIQAKGPLQRQIILHLLCYAGNQGISLSYTLKTNRQPTLPSSYYYRIGMYSECSASCGGGTQTRQVDCTHLDTGSPADGSFCAGLARPVGVRDCALQLCDAKWNIIGDWSTCSVSCGNGSRTREVVCQREGIGVAERECRGQKKPRSVKECNTFGCPSWRAEAWLECSRTCGDGQRRRIVACYYPKYRRAVKERYCRPDSRPEEVEACDLGECRTTFSWQTSEWSRCTVTCGEGLQSRNVYCTTGSDSATNDSDCAGQVKPNDTQPCRLEHCGPRWLFSEWSPCSQSCGSSVRTREVCCIDAGTTCGNTSASCAALRPSNKERCDEVPACTPWSTTPPTKETSRPVSPGAIRYSATVVIGSSFQASCSASALPLRRPSIQWSRNGATLPGAFPRVVVRAVSEQTSSGEILETRMLVIGDVRRGDEGPYVCTIQLPESSTRLTQTTILSVVERLNGELTVKPRPIVPPDCVDSSQDTCRRLAGLGHCEFNDVKRRCCRSCWESENN
eukprot:m.32924 g.32924  ORF g.32924 m.32924 type:complete len:767 (+) comp31728_c0_seq3:100-2400(+)